MGKVTFSQCIDNYFEGLRTAREIWGPVLIALIVSGILTCITSFLLSALIHVLSPSHLLSHQFSPLAGKILGGLFGLGMLNATCLYMFHDRPISWDSAISILWNKDFLLKALGVLGMNLVVMLLIYLAGLLITLISTFIAIAAFNSPHVAILISVLILIPVGILTMVIQTGFGLASYLIAPGGKNSPVIASVEKGLKASFSNLSVTWSAILISLEIFFTFLIAMLPMYFLAQFSLGLTVIYFLLLILVMMPAFYALQCFICKTADDVFTDPLAVDDEKNTINAQDENNRLNNFY